MDVVSVGFSFSLLNATATWTRSTAMEDMIGALETEDEKQRGRELHYYSRTSLPY
jgi:hypothetical protein